MTEREGSWTFPATTDGRGGGELLREMAIDRLVPHADAHPGMARVRRMTRDALALVEDMLGRSPSIAGDRFTGADVMMSFWFTTAPRFRPLDLAAYPGISASLARIGERPTYRRAMELAGPDAVG